MKKIFIIEDEDTIRENLESLLEMEGYKAYSSGLGKKGIDLIIEIKPDLILCDIMLPDTDGYEIIKKIRENNLIKNTPFVF